MSFLSKNYLIHPASAPAFDSVVLHLSRLLQHHEPRGAYGVTTSAGGATENTMILPTASSAPPGLSDINLDATT